MFETTNQMWWGPPLFALPSRGASRRNMTVTRKGANKIERIYARRNNVVRRNQRLIEPWC